jgi:serralysin
MPTCTLTTGNDLFKGSNSADVIKALDGHDVIYGGKGNDILRGEAGDDVLIGGMGRDIMTGGAGKDRFVWTSTQESRALAQDRVMDFDRGMDLIDLSLIDANTKLAGDQAFTLNTTGSFSGKAGALIWSVITNAEGGQSALLMADTNGDKLVDMSIEFVGVTSFSNADFIF